MVSARPTVVAVVIGAVQLEAESLLVQRDGPFEIRDFEYDGHEPVRKIGHPRIMPDLERSGARHQSSHSHAPSRHVT